MSKSNPKIGPALHRSQALLLPAGTGAWHTAGLAFCFDDETSGPGDRR